MRNYTARIYFEDECPRLGCGWRTVKVREARKWVYLTDCMGRRVRVTKDQLAKLLRRAKLERDMEYVTALCGL